jgi:hypothetical protein
VFKKCLPWITFLSGLLVCTGVLATLAHAAQPETIKPMGGTTSQPASLFDNNPPPLIDMPSELLQTGEAAGINYDWKIAGWGLGYYKSAGDVNGDGYDDVIVGLPMYDNTGDGYEQGRVYVYHGSASGLNATPNWTKTFTGTQSARFGSSVNTAGDVNNDGYDDVIIGAEEYNSYTGAAYVYLGSASGLSASPTWFKTGGGTNFAFGYSVSTAGDVNKDGYDDFLVGAPWYPGEPFISKGIVYLFYGSSTGPSTTPDWSKIGSTNDSHFGDIVATAGDVNGDGYADILVGTFWQGPGRVESYYGGASGLNAIASWGVNGELPPPNGYYHHFGRWISSAGDINNDGYDDVIIGAPMYYDQQGASGKAYVYHGSSSGLSSAPNWTAVGQSSAGLGWYVSTAGDVNGDGYSDVIIGAPWFNPNWGRVFVYYGSSSSLETSPAWTVDGDWSYASLGGGAAAGDVNKDGYSDVLFHGTSSIGMPTVYAIYGKPDVAISGLMATNNGPTPIGGATILTATITAGSFVKFNWSFGDGQTGIGRVVTHTYQMLGAYTAMVTATNHMGSQVAATLVNVRCDCCARLNNAAAYYPSVQAAVDASSSASDIVKVAGTCRGVNHRGGLSQLVYLNKTLTIQGGYTTTNWTSPNLIANPSTLDAQGQGRTLYITGNNTPLIQGLRLTGGNAAGLDGGPPGMDAGGGAYIITATATVRDCEIFGNQADYGGGLSIVWSPATLKNNHIHDNTAAGGVGGLDIYGSAVTLDGNKIESNSAGAVYGGNGGGISGDNSNLILRGNTIISNTALYHISTDEGGLGGGLYLTNGSVVTMTGNLVQGNTAGLLAGGFYGEHGYYILSENLFISNSAVESGGGLSFLETDANLDNTVIINNQASKGSGLSITRAAIYLRHTTLAGNSTSGIAIEPTEGKRAGPVYMTNTILVDHTVGISVTSGNTLTLNAILWDIGTPITLAKDAMAVVSVQNDWVGNPAFAPDGYHLTSASDAINAGIPGGLMVDIDSQPRPMNAGYDLGADEYPEIMPLSVSGGTVSTPDQVLTFTWSPGQPITLTYASQLNTTYQTADFDFGGMVFHLEATDQNGNPIITPTTPLTLIIHYNDADLPPGTIEGSLKLYRYDETLSAWVALTVLSRDTAANTLTVLLDHFSEFALMAGKYKIFLPVVLR